MIHFVVYGDPVPQGSASGFPVRRKNGAIGVAITSSNAGKLKPWRSDMTRVAIMEAQSEIGQPVASKHEPVYIELDFYFQKPPSAPKKRTMPAVKPDLDKLVRAALDAFTGVLWVDDAQVCEVVARKHYGTPRVEVRMHVAIAEGPSIPADFERRENVPSTVSR